MKSNFIFLIILLSTFLQYKIVFPQELTDEKKQILIELLNSSNSSDVVFAADEIARTNYVEALPRIVEKFWENDSYTRYVFLNVLNKFQYEQTHQLTLAYYDSLDTYNSTDKIFTSAQLKTLANSILFSLGDYSKRQSVFDYINLISPNLDKQDVFLLKKIVENVPQDAEYAKNELIMVASTSSDALLRYYIITFLYEHFGEQILSFVVQRFVDEPDYVNRDLILKEILSVNRTKEIHNLLSLQSILEINDQVKTSIIECLLQTYGSPIDIKTAREVENHLNDEIQKNYLHKVIIDKFKPKIPTSNPSLPILIDSLISYSSQCFILNWIGNTNYSHQSQTLINEARFKLTNADSLGTAIKIKQYQSLINQAYKDSTAERYVTSDGYKFLYYYPQYILERLPKIPTVKLESSTGALLPQGNLQYYEGGWKDAIDNGDGTFSVDTKQKTVSLRMNYAYGSQTKSNVTVGTDTVVFQTVNAKVQLQNSIGAAIDTGKVQYYAGAWRDFGATINGTASKELLPGEIQFRVIYKSAVKEKTQDISKNNVVEFVY